VNFFPPRNLIFWTSCFVLFAAYLWNFNAPLQGVHSIRQSDTIFTAYSYCIENSQFLLPKIAHRENTEGVAIGEFPLYSFLLSIPCEISGEWSEWYPKFFVLILWILNMFVWLRWAQGYLRLKKEDLLSFGVLFGFSTYSVLYMTISIPDNLVLFLMGVTGLLQQSSRFKTWQKHVLSGLVFCLGFSIRPYFIPLAILFTKNRRWILSVGVVCILIYIVWYKWWSQNSQIVGYYYIAIPPLLDVLKAMPHYILKLFDVILRDFFNYLFFPLIIWKRKDLKKTEIFGLISSFLMVLFARGNHSIIHGYYLWAMYIFGVLCLYRAFATFKPKTQSIFLILFILITIAQTQHHFHRQAEFKSQMIQKLAIDSNVPANAKIAVYAANESCSTNYLYWLKRTGWCLGEKDFKGPEHCPQGADYFLAYEGANPLLKPCIASPRGKRSGK
jgi:hypothetical protein